MKFKKQLLIFSNERNDILENFSGNEVNTFQLDGLSKTGIDQIDNARSIYCHLSDLRVLRGRFKYVTQIIDYHDTPIGHLESLEVAIVHINNYEDLFKLREFKNLITSILQLRSAVECCYPDGINASFIDEKNDIDLYVYLFNKSIDESLEYADRAAFQIDSMFRKTYTAYIHPALEDCYD